MKKTIGIYVSLIVMLAIIIIPTNAEETNACDYDGDGDIDLTDIIYHSMIVGEYQNQNPIWDLHVDGVVDLSDIIIFSQNIHTPGWCHAQFWDYLSDEPEQETHQSTGSSGSSKKRWDLDRYGSYTYFSIRPTMFECGEEKYRFDWHLFWARVLDINGKQVRSPSVHIFGDNIFHLENCDLKYEGEYRRVTLTKLEEQSS